MKNKIEELEKELAEAREDLDDASDVLYEAEVADIEDEIFEAGQEEKYGRLNTKKHNDNTNKNSND